MPLQTDHSRKQACETCRLLHLPFDPEVVVPETLHKRDRRPHTITLPPFNSTCLSLVAAPTFTTQWGFLRATGS